ncbi:MAG: hypothetical protein RL434_772 [Pseudomonadota bacterium]
MFYYSRFQKISGVKAHFQKFFENFVTIFAPEKGDAVIIPKHQAFDHGKMQGNMRKALLGTSLLAGFLLLPFCGMPAHAAGPAQDIEVYRQGTVEHVRLTTSDAPRHHAPSHVLVSFRGRPASLPGSGAMRALGAAGDVHRIQNPPGLSVEQVLERYRRDPNVLYAEPDYVVRANQVPDDPAWLAGEQQNLEVISAPAAWSLQAEQSSVVVAIFDTGIDFSHPDLTDSLWSHPGSPGTQGYTCTQGVCAPGGGDDNGHGTHVAGIIGARGNNGLGVASVNWQLRLLPIKFLAANGSGLVSDAIAGLDLVRSLKASGVNIRVANHSWGGAAYSQALKDAMTALEAAPASTLHVCAAGNSASNADFAPAYPAAFDNRGILSVLATTNEDRAASFSNYGVTSVDIAAPGVEILSTANQGQCAYCDASGYRRLSGTSMATPHVAGVAAALLARYPGLTAAQARDVLLHPDSYDTVQDDKALMTSTGGRLNSLKALSNLAYAFNPVPNTFPSLTPGPNLEPAPGATVDLSDAVQATDADGDSLRVISGRGQPTDRPAWLIGAQAEQVFPQNTPYAAPLLARAYAMPYFTSVNDGRGGGTTVSRWVTVNAAMTPGQPPAGALKLPAQAAVNEPVTLEFAALDPEGGPVMWERWIVGGNTAMGACCYTSDTNTVYFQTPGSYRVSVQAMDRELNLSQTYSATIAIGGTASRLPPEAKAALSASTGRVPFTVDIDMRGSVDPDGSITSYVMDCGNGGYRSGTSGLGSCTFTQPGPHWLLLQVLDNDGQLGITSAYVVATPGEASAPDRTAPAVVWSAPAPSATLRGANTLGVTASDELPGSGVARVEFFLDGESPGQLLGTAAKAPYTLNWDTWGIATGVHRLLAIAWDAAGNRSVTAVREVTIAAPRMPKISLSANKLSVAQSGNVNLAAALTNQPTYGVQRVEFIISGTRTVCTDTTAPYTCRWTAPSKAGSRSFTARAWDWRGNARDSNIVTIQVY